MDGGDEWILGKISRGNDKTKRPRNLRIGDISSRGYSKSSSSRGESPQGSPRLNKGFSFPSLTSSNAPSQSDTAGSAVVSGGAAGHDERRSPLPPRNNSPKQQWTTPPTTRVRRANSGEAFRFSERQSPDSPRRLFYHKDSLASSVNLLRKNSDGLRSASPPIAVANAEEPSIMADPPPYPQHGGQHHQQAQHSSAVSGASHGGHSPEAPSSQGSVSLGGPSPSPPSCSPTPSPHLQSPQHSGRPQGTPYVVGRARPAVRLQPDEKQPRNIEESLENGGTCFEFDTPAAQRNLAVSSPIAKSVSFHSGTSLPEERKISSAYDCLQFMMKGCSLLKVRASSRQYRRYFTLDEDLAAVRWVPSSKKSNKAKLTISQIREVRLGKTTDILRDKEVAGCYSEDCVFSVIYGDTYESLDLVASTADEANFWVTGLSMLVTARRGGPQPGRPTGDAAMGAAGVAGAAGLTGGGVVPANLEERQLMREKWLEQCFRQADTDRKGLLEESETIALAKKINSQLSTVRLRQKIQEFSIESGERTGRIDQRQFVSLFKDLATRPEVFFLMVRYSGKDYFAKEDLHFFLEGEQEMETTEEDVARLIEEFEPSEEARSDHQMLLDGFTLFLLSQHASLMPRSRVHHDMTQPFTHYFISTSYNTWQVEDESEALSSVEGYVQALTQGCRCVKVDLTLDDQNNFVIGGTLSLQEVLDTIRDFAFAASKYPLIVQLNFAPLSHEDACRLALELRTSLGEQLYVPSTAASESGQAFSTNVSPESLKHKILLYFTSPVPLSGTKGGGGGSTTQTTVTAAAGGLAATSSTAGTVGGGGGNSTTGTNSNHSSRKENPAGGLNSSAVGGGLLDTEWDFAHSASELAELATLNQYNATSQFVDLASQQNQQLENEVCVLSEAAALKLCHSLADELVHHSKRFLTHVEPGITRSENAISQVNPLELWAAGIQMAATNFQAPCAPVDIYRGWFSQNGRCGYVLKPSCLRQPWTVFNAFKKEIVNDTEPMYLRIKLISGQQLPLPRGASVKASSIDPYVLLQVFGIPADCAEARTKTVSNEGQSPIFDESFEFTISAPQLAVLRLTVLDDDFIGDDFIGQRSLPVSSLRPGYRHVTLLADSGHPLLHATLFVHVTMCSRSPNDKKLRRKRSWQTKMASGSGGYDLRPTGLKPVDETCRNGAALLTECAKLKAALDKAMIELCEECGLPTSSNLAQCLRVLVQRVAGCPDISSFGIDTSGPFPEVRLQGEPSGPKSAKCLLCFERVLQECTYVVQNAQQLSEGLKDLYNNIQLHATELPSLCSSQKSKKADKAAENFIWNAAFIESRIETVASLTHECQTYLSQITRLQCAVERIFQREKTLLQSSSVAVSSTISGAAPPTSTAGSQPSGAAGTSGRTRTSSSLSITPPVQLSSSAPATPPPVSPGPDHAGSRPAGAATHKKGILKKPSSPIQISQQDLATSL